MRRKKFVYIVPTALVLLSVILKSCFYDPDQDVYVVNYDKLDLNIRSVSCTSAVFVGLIPYPYSSGISARGFYWSATSPNPTANDNIIDKVTVISDAMCSFFDTLTGLTPSTKYYVTAYAKKNSGTKLAGPHNFTTLPGVPIVLTSIILEYTKSTAIVGGNVLYEGLSRLTDCGIYWGLSETLLTTGTKLSIAKNMGLFSYNLTSLIPNTTYYIKAYAANGSGEAYGLTYKFNTGQSSDIPTIKDADGNIYHYAKIGNQYWTVENLKTTKLNDGTPIMPFYWGSTSTPAYCYYWDNDSTNKMTYGALYNFYAVETGKLCPAGWHVPSDAEWSILTTYLGGEAIAGQKLKEIGTTHWKDDSGATNESFFSALPGGYRVSGDGDEEITAKGIWWTSTKISTGSGLMRSMGSGNNKVNRLGETGVYKNWAFSVRCIKD